MSGASPSPLAGLEGIVAPVLRHGTRAATLVIAVGLLLGHGAPAAGLRLVEAGLAVFILLPVARVAIMLIFFAAARDYRFALLAGCVLAIIAGSALVAVR